MPSILFSNCHGEPNRSVALGNRHLNRPPLRSIIRTVYSTAICVAIRIIEELVFYGVIYTQRIQVIILSIMYTVSRTILLKEKHWSRGRITSNRPPAAATSPHHHAAASAAAHQQSLQQTNNDYGWWVLGRSAATMRLLRRQR